MTRTRQGKLKRQLQEDKDEDNDYKKQKTDVAEIPLVTTCIMKAELIKDTKEILIPNALPFRLYTNEGLLFTVITVSIKKTVVTLDYANGNGTISFKSPVDPMFILLEYCRKSTLELITIKFLKEEFEFDIDLEAILEDCIGECTFVANGKFDVKKAKAWLCAKKSLISGDMDIKHLALSVFVHDSLM